MKVVLNNLDDTKKLSKEIAKILQDGDVVFFVGDLGTGKTTIINFICEEYGLSAKSPTFSLVNLYQGKRNISHIDLYRLESYFDAINIGIEDILDDDTIKLIEWPEILGDEPCEIKINLYYENGNRVAEIHGDALKRSEIYG